MQTAHLTDPEVLSQGTFSMSRLDPYTGNLASVGTPALVADIDPTTGIVYAASAAGIQAGSWTVSGNDITTSTAGSTWSTTTNVYAMDVQYLTPAIGAIAHVSVDGQVRKGFDTSNSAENVWRLYLDGQIHNVAIEYNGDAVVGAPLIGTPSDTGGTPGLAAATHLARTGAPVTEQTWTLAAQSSSSVGIFDQTLVAAPTTAPTGTASTTGGAVPAGNHTYLATFVNPTGETAAGAASAVVATTGTTSSVALASIPTGPAATTARRVYRSDGAAYGLVLTISDNTTVTGTDTAATLGVAPPSPGTALTLVGTLAAGQTSTTFIPGVSTTIVTGTWDATSNAHVTTIAPTLGLAQFTTYLGLSAVASYSSPVLDGGDALSAWPLLEMRRGANALPAAVVQLGIGQSETPDGSWTWANLASTVVADPDGNPWQRVVATGNAARGRFAQFIVALDQIGGAWASDLRLFWWVPETDPFLRLFPRQTYRGAAVTAPLLAAIAALFATVDEQADSLLDGSALATAYAGYLTGYGEQFAMPRLLGEGDSAYRARLSTLFAGRYQGGSQPFLQVTISGALGVPVQVAPVPRGSSEFVLGSTGVLGAQGLGQTMAGYWQWTVTIPFSGLQVAPETVTQIIDQLRPVGSVVSILYS